jgi:hypothetical protein
VIKNVTTVPIKYLFFVPQPDAPNNCFSFSPDIMTFNPPLLPGQSATLAQRFPQTVTLHVNANCPKPLCYLAAAHDTNLANCCSVKHCVTALNSPIVIGGDLDGSVFSAGSTIGVPVLLDTSIVKPSLVTLHEGTNVYRISNIVTMGMDGISFVLSNVVVGTHGLTASVTDQLDAIWDSELATFYVVQTDFQGESAPAPIAAPLLPGPTISGGQVSFSLQTASGVNCSVEYTESLAAPNWKLFQTITGDGSVVTVSDALTNAPQRFYRVRMQ